MSNDILSRLATIETKLDSTNTWLKALDKTGIELRHLLSIQNGRVHKNDTGISDLRIKMKFVSQQLKDMNGWTRQKTLLVFGGVQTILIALAMFWITKG